MGVEQPLLDEVAGELPALEEAIVLFYARGDRASAEPYYEYLRDNYKDIDGTTRKRYLIGLDAFVLGEVPNMRTLFGFALIAAGSFFIFQSK